MSYLIYDTEIIKCIPSGEDDDPNLEYCGGWDDFENMGISVFGFYSSDTDDINTIAVYDYDDEGDFLDRIQSVIDDHEYIIGFNSLKFDDNLLRANDVVIETDYDILQEIRIAAYGSFDWRDQPKGYSYSLNAIAKANLQKQKTGRGDIAPVLWQQGKYEDVRSYCRIDVYLTVQIFDLIQDEKLIDPNTGSRLLVRLFEY